MPALPTRTALRTLLVALLMLLGLLSVTLPRPDLPATPVVPASVSAP